MIVVLGLLAVYYIELTTVQRDYFMERHGTLVNVSQQPHEIGGSDRILQNTTLVSSSGLTVEMRLLRPANSDRRMLPTVLLIGGQRTGKYVVDLVERPGNVVFAAIDYPYGGPERSNGFWQTARAIPGIQRAAIDTPPALLLAVDWLVDQPWADPQQVELAGVSFGVPFAAAAGAIDDRISRVWLVHGGADNLSWAELNLRSAVANDFNRRVVARLALLLIYGESFNTLAWMREISPRPIVVISARDDERVPRGSALADAANAQTAEIIWTEGRHIGRNRKEELQQLLGIFRAHVDPRGAQ